MAVINGKFRIVSNNWVNAEYKHMVVDIGSTLSKVEPGQFFYLQCPHTEADKPFFRRPMSTYHYDEKMNNVEFLYKVTGAGTRGLAILDKDDFLQLLGPLGVGFTIKPSYRHIMVVARGVGLATLAPLAELASKMNIHVTALLSARDNERLMSQHRFLNIGAKVIEVIDTDQSSSVGNVEKLIRKVHNDNPVDAIYTCGSARITRMLQQLILDINVVGEVALEKHMACGVGLCYCCVHPIRVGVAGEIKSKRVCADGPVFDIKQVCI
ncbi:dihydroorotate dehydrogenase electron transfer subunit [Aeromonas jandaei]